MAMYGVATLPLLRLVQNTHVTHKRYADDGSAVGQLEKFFFKQLTTNTQRGRDCQLKIKLILKKMNFQEHCVIARFNNQIKSFIKYINLSLILILRNVLSLTDAPSINLKLASLNRCFSKNKPLFESNSPDVSQRQVS